MKFVRILNCKFGIGIVTDKRKDFLDDEASAELGLRSAPASARRIGCKTISLNDRKSLENKRLELFLELRNEPIVKLFIKRLAAS